MQQAPDCDMMLAHDDNLVSINGIGHDSVSKLLKSGRIVLYILVVSGNPRTGCDDGSTPGSNIKIHEVLYGKLPA